MEAPGRVKLLAGLGLVCVQTTVGVLYKLSQAATGGFHYSTMSAVAIAECVKLCMSTVFHVVDSTHRAEGISRVASAWDMARSQLSALAVLHIMSLSFMYTLNNQVSFYVYTLADPGTIFLFKASSTMIVAAIQCTCVGKSFSFEQWKAMMLQALGMIIVQHDPCRGGALYPWLAYALMAFSSILSALCAVRNEYLVKNYKVCLNVQNATLYAGGAGMNLLAFWLLPNPNNSQAALRFFDGYDNPLAIGVIMANALIGIAITAVYKYADAVTKCIASDVTAVVLCILSSFFFHLQASLTTWCGVLVVCFAVHFYTAASQPPPKAPEKPQARDLELQAAPSPGKSDEAETATMLGRANGAK